jgi:cytochrome b561
MNGAQEFAWTSRVLHWLMAVLVLAMLAVGMSMVASLANYHWLLSIHRPLGIAIWVLLILRFVNRQLEPPPEPIPTLSRLERLVASGSERLLYVLLFTLPLVGWGMLSAARYPVVICGTVHLPWILPRSMRLYAVLREAHTLLAYLLFFTFMAHLSAVLFHTLVLRDGLLLRMAPWRRGPRTVPEASPGRSTTRTRRPRWPAGRRSPRSPRWQAPSASTSWRRPRRPVSCTRSRRADVR